MLEDFGINTLAAATVNYLLGTGFDSWGFNPRSWLRPWGAVLILPGILWLPAQIRWAGSAEFDEH